MNWNEAVEAMRRGKVVRRVSESVRTKIAPDIIETGREPTMLAHAWTVDEQPALIFQGAWTKVLFVPDSDCREATDWVVMEPL